MISIIHTIKPIWGSSNANKGLFSQNNMTGNTKNIGNW